MIEVLRRNRHLRSSEEVASFDCSLAELARSPRDDDLPALHTVFDDDCQQPEVMYGLVHFLESFDMRRQLAAFIEAVPEMSVQAREWAKVLL